MALYCCIIHFSWIAFKTQLQENSVAWHIEPRGMFRLLWKGMIHVYPRFQAPLCWPFYRVKHYRANVEMWLKQVCVAARNLFVFIFYFSPCNPSKERALPEWLTVLHNHNPKEFCKGSENLYPTFVMRMEWGVERMRTEGAKLLYQPGLPHWNVFVCHDMPCVCWHVTSSVLVICCLFACIFLPTGVKCPCPTAAAAPANEVAGSRDCWMEMELCGDVAEHTVVHSPRMARRPGDETKCIFSCNSYGGLCVCIWKNLCVRKIDVCKQLVVGSIFLNKLCPAWVEEYTR